MSFIYVLLGVSILFVLIGFIVNEKNAKYILSGYNTMSEEERSRINIKYSLRHFKKFHIFLGISLFVLGAVLNYFNSNWAGIFIVFYPIIAYIFFVIGSSKYNRGNSKSVKITVFVLLAVLILIAFSMFDGYKNDKLTFDAHKIEIGGEYGETIEVKEIKSIQLVNTLPEISYKTNGFSLGTVSKGYFKNKKGEKVKLLLNNSDNAPYILIIKKNGEKIYYSSKKDSEQVLFDEIKNYFNYN